MSNFLVKTFGASWPTTAAGLIGGVGIAVGPIVTNTLNHVSAGEVVDWKSVGIGAAIAVLGYLAKYHKASNAPIPLATAQTVVPVVPETPALAKPAIVEPPKP